MSSRNTSTTSFRIEQGVLICSVPGKPDRRIPTEDVSGWLSNAEGGEPMFQLMMKGGGTIDLRDPKGELKRVLSALNFVDLDEELKSSGQLHVDERLGRFNYSDGAWRLRAKVDLPFQADVSVGFDLETDTRQFPESMIKNVCWIQDNLGEIWNAAARLVNTLIETENIPAPERFSLHHLWANIPDAPLDAAKWKFTVEVVDMYRSFEVIFHGLEPVSCNLA